MTQTPTVKGLVELLKPNNLFKSCSQDLLKFEVSGAYCDSRRYKPGGIFFCKGVDFRQEYLEDVFDKGCKVYIHEGGIGGGIEVTDIRKAMAKASKFAWGEPDKYLKIVGITGTKGKTTVACMVKQVIEQSGYKCGYIGTHHVSDGRHNYTTQNTTPESPELYEYLNSMRINDCDFCVMEVSSQALKYDRIGDMQIDIACITNVGIDHISDVEHPTVEDYVKSKFEIAHHAEKLVASRKPALVDDVQPYIDGCFANCTMEPIIYDAKGLEIELSLPGEFNKKNGLAALKICKLLGFDDDGIREILKNASVPGRMEVNESKDGRLIGIVDYAHTKESYELFFKSVNEKYLDSFKIAYFGASGGKAVARQIDLPKTISRFADFVIVTSDDPGSEDPAQLCERVASNLEMDNSTFLVEPNRDAACIRAFEIAGQALKAHDRVIVCALGKGDEDVCVAKPKDIPIIPDTVHVKQKIEEYNDSL